MVFNVNELNKHNTEDVTIESLQTISIKILDKHAPVLHKHIRANQVPYMNKALQKAVMTRSRYKNNYLKCRTVENRNIYKKQRNLCYSLFRKEKKDYFSNLDTKSVTHNNNDSGK